jgi:glycolate oxidase FAD binding subunit
MGRLLVESLAWLQQRILDAAQHQIPLRLRGSGSKDFYGEAARGEALDVSVHQGIVSYEPTELVITAKAGTALSLIEQSLAEHRQMLAFEPPHFGPQATVGGMVAAGLSGPRRATSGAVRDFVLGISLIDTNAEVLRFGGEVMKNVAGYDLSRLHVGALGTLGVIAEVSLKVWPMPAASETLWLAMDASAAIEHLNRWAAEPWPLSASAWVDGHLILRLEGAQAAVSQAATRWQKDYQAKFLSADQARQFWDDLKEQRLAFFGAVRQSSKALWRVSLPSASAHQPSWGDTVIEWGGALRWVLCSNDDASIREQARALGGHASLFRSLDKRHPVFSPLAPAMLALQRRIKREFDPLGIFNPGRLMPSLDVNASFA